MKTILTALLLACYLPAQAAALPEAVLQELRLANIPPDAVSIDVRDEKKSLFSHRATVASNPASTMKLLTTYAGLKILGPAYRWKTEIYLDGKLEGDTLHGNLVFKGYGDPKLTEEELWLWLRELRQRGLKEIRGDIVLDNSFFALIAADPASFDNKPARAYNVLPDALLLNFNSQRLRLLPNGEKSTALLEPVLDGYTLDNRVRTSAELPCKGEDAYKSRLENHQIIVEGLIPAGCGSTQDYFSLLPHDAYFFALFKSLWQELGGSIQGSVKQGITPPDLIAYSTHQSPPLSEIIRDINKYSNNIMARQLFLTLGANNHASIEYSTRGILSWLTNEELTFPELVLENGAGLSRLELISAQHLADILQKAEKSPFSAEFEASLPILGLDGTVKGRLKDSEEAGYAHLKTGSLEGVKSIAGYVHAKSGKKWMVVFIINHPNAKYGRAAQDALITWLQKNR